MHIVQQKNSRLRIKVDLVKIIHLSYSSQLSSHFFLVECPQRSNECACLSRARARVGMDCTISIETSSAKMAADLNFAVCVSLREDKPKTKQLRFLL